MLSELDYAFYQARELTGKGANDARAFMLRTERWKYVHYKGFPPQLFDLQEDPNEFVDLGRSAAHETGAPGDARPPARTPHRPAQPHHRR